MNAITHIAAPSAMRSVAPISLQIWDEKYRLKQPDGTPVDGTIEHTWARVARALAAVEADPGRFETAFYEALEGFKFLLAGRILAGAGSGRSVTLFNCFVGGDIPDTLEGIFQSVKEAALTMQQGGGIGFDFSSLRPKGAPVKGVGADASGPLSFMDVWDAMCRTIMSAGTRRGAMMATMRCDHPDIEAFIEAKRDPLKLRMFNLSVLVTEAFLDAVEREADWDLIFDGTVYRTINARDLWDKIMRATYDCAEPGVVFIDRINERNNLAYCERIRATNPCGEVPLPPHGACLLGSINLASFVRDPFTADAHLDEAALEKTIPVAVRMLDNVIDVSRYPLEQQRAEAKAKRRIGLGVTGLADALIMLGFHYGSERARAAVSGWMGSITRTAYLASCELAAEKGPFPLFDRDAYLASSGVAALPAEVRQRIFDVGIRNALLTSIAPTGTISLFADNVSSGLEPLFALEYTRKVLDKGGGHREERVSSLALRRFREIHREEAPLPDTFVTTANLTPEDHVLMQAAVQQHIDAAISKTINVPKDIPLEDFKDVYRLAYQLGCKGCTTFRPNDVTGSILETDRTADEPGAADMEAAPDILSRDERLEGATYKLKWLDSDHAMYVTINDVTIDGRRRPFEIFVNSKNMEHYAWVVSLTRMVSAVFRHSDDISFVADELKAIFDPRGGQWGQGSLKGRFIPSLPAAIGYILERHMIDIGFLPARTMQTSAPSAVEVSSAARIRSGEPCPKCHQPGLVHQGGCVVCLECGWSKCT